MRIVKQIIFIFMSHFVKDMVISLQYIIFYEKYG